jgi:hypothetical protein
MDFLNHQKKFKLYYYIIVLKIVIFKSFHEVKTNLFKNITYKYFNMFSDFFIHYIGFAFLRYVYQHFENKIILKN